MSLFPLKLKAGTLIDAPLAQVERCLLHWASGHPAERDIRGQRRRASLAEAIGFLEPRYSSPDRALLVAHVSGWTAFFNNHSRQFQPQAELFVLCERLRARTCFFLHETEGHHAGTAVFEHYQHAVPEGVMTRSLWLGKEERWKFVETGKPLPFERPEVYATPRVRDRLPPELLCEYGSALGVPFWEIETYSDDIAFLGWRSMATTCPQAKGVKIICHVCNDIGGWGKGFVLAVSKRWKEPEAAYRKWHAAGKGGRVRPRGRAVRPGRALHLGRQHGRSAWRGSAGPPIRYEAVAACLQQVAAKARELGASVHMPRIGCGLSGGKWPEVEPLIEQHLGKAGVPVTVYDFD